MFDWLKGAGLQGIVDGLPVSFSDVASRLGEAVLPVASLASWGGLVLCSVVVLGLLLERSVVLRRRRIIPAGFLEQVRRHWYRGDVKGALACCDEGRTAISRVLRAGLGRHDAAREEIEKALEVAGQLELYSLSSYIRGFGLVASLAPMLGFLGTVTGMIGAFNAIAAAGASNPTLVANGISAALLSTASGLVIGIPALAMYHFFRGRVDRFVQEMEEVALELVEDLVQHQRIRLETAHPDAV
ncbi:MAG: MotA/TolQ/ExbB proton channel family protein [Candidatus Tectomicrobia bacterium]|nr:MotA/TolQ/ExbB proton channel family protein [Candidatus Tectomicrobia bacterium]